MPTDFQQWQRATETVNRMHLIRHCIENMECGTNEEAQTKDIAKMMLDEIEETQKVSHSYPTFMMTELEEFLKKHGIEIPGARLMPSAHHRGVGTFTYF